MARRVRSRPQESFESDRLSGREVRDRLELRVEVAVAEKICQPEGTHLASHPRQRSEVAERVPLRQRRVVRSHPDEIGEGTQSILENLEESFGLALEEEPARSAVDLRAHPAPAERGRERALSFRTVGPEEERPRVPPAIKPAESPAVQNALGLFQPIEILAARSARRTLFFRTDQRRGRGSHGSIRGQ